MDRLTQLLRRFARDRGGALAIVLALALIPLSVAALGAVDLTRAVTARQNLQDSLDAAALAALRTVIPQRTPPSDQDKTALLNAGRSNLVQNLGPNADMTLVNSNFVYGSNGASAVIGDARATVPAILAWMLNGGKPIEVTAHSEVQSATTKAEVALVLDVTDSMRQNDKIGSLKIAATDLINIVLRDNNSTSKVALVPYSNSVNVGEYAPLVRGPRPGSYSFTAYDGTYRTYYLSPSCVTERSETTPTDAPPKDNNSYVGALYLPTSRPCPSATITPLTNNKSLLIDSVKRYSPTQTTAGHIGLAWGWYVISPNFLGNWQNVVDKPADYFSKPPDQVLKFIVLMTDGMFNTAYCNGVFNVKSTAVGDNEKARCAGNGSSFDQAKRLCDAIKAKGVIIYTVGLDLKDQSASDLAASKDVLSYCASDPARFYLPETGADLQSTFQAIGQEIASLHITR